nr:IclR family transcriptional regulator C-terminal domain-containing protein [Burkholderia sp. L27(2015)]
MGRRGTRRLNLWLAVPVRDKDGLIVASVNVSLPTGQIDQKGAVQLYLAELRHAASQLRAAS